MTKEKGETLLHRGKIIYVRNQLTFIPSPNGFCGFKSERK